MSALTVPRLPPHRPSAARKAAYQVEREAFCAALLELGSRVEFRVSARGWCYILETERNLPKGDFDVAEELINDCRKDGLLPLDFCADDGARAFEGVEEIDDPDPDAEAHAIVASLKYRHRYYFPFSFWDNQRHYVQMLVEKVDLKSLFKPVCEPFLIPIANARGWADLNCRADMMRRFAEHEAAGRQGVLLYCGDHDPVGLNISTALRSNMADMAAAVGWSPDHLIIDRFGLNADFVARHRISWIDGLETASGKNLADPKHRDHRKPYVQDYLSRFGARKVEANALVTMPEAARALCRRAIIRYLHRHAPADYERELEEPREQLRQAIVAALSEGEP